MREEIEFLPPRRFGMLLQTIIAVVLLIGGLFGVWRALQTDIGIAMLLYLLPSLLVLGAVPILAYHVYALSNANYKIERDGIRLRWGLRLVDIPITTIQWVHPTDQLDIRLPLPLIRWPGAVMGVRHVPGEGQVEYLASRTRNLILIATPERAYAISPKNPAEFMHTYQRCTEMGSFTPIAARSVYPTLFISQVWSAFPARIVLLTGAFLSLSLFLWVSLSIPSQPQIHLRFLPDGSPGYLVPAIRLLLLPFPNTFIFLTNLFIGMYFFRNESNQHLAYLLWGSSAVTSSLFLVAVYFILGAG
jgi:hypothetical protein